MKKFQIYLGIFIIWLAFSSNTYAYSDVPSNNEYYKGITFISDNNIVNGYSDGTYRPEKTLNRAELLKIVIEAKFSNEFEEFNNKSCFKDTPRESWFTKYVCFAKSKKIIMGYSDNTFKPEKEVNFVEALKIVSKTFEIPYKEETDPWYKGIVKTSSLNNAIPLDINSFDGGLTRGQMADMIARVMKKLQSESILQEYLESRSRGRKAGRTGRITTPSSARPWTRPRARRGWSSSRRASAGT
jgi:hypothetical protein